MSSLDDLKLGNLCYYFAHSHTQKLNFQERYLFRSSQFII